MARHTPASRLQTLCMLNDRELETKPRASGPPHKPIFSCTVTVAGLKGISAVATGSTKANAKHAACNLVLKQIVDGCGGHRWNDLDSVLKDWKFEDYEGTRSQSSNENANNDDHWNFVGSLNEFCVGQTTRKIVGPEYKHLEAKNISPTEWSFTIECNVYLVTDSETHTRIATTGTASSKTIAKRRSAAEMCRKLQEMGFGLTIKPIEFYKPEITVDAVVSSETETSKEQGAMLETGERDVSENQSSATDESSDAPPDSFSKLTQLVANLNMKAVVQYHNADSCRLFKCMITVASENAPTDSVSVVCGEHNHSFEAAKQSAAQKLIQVLTNDVI